MTHEYSKFKNKNIPYAKVGRRVFNSLFDAETFCTEHGLDVNSAIEYRDDPELKNRPIPEGHSSGMFRPAEGPC